MRVIVLQINTPSVREKWNLLSMKSEVFCTTQKIVFHSIFLSAR
jgi:hypothetical protein